MQTRGETWFFVIPLFYALKKNTTETNCECKFKLNKFFFFFFFLRYREKKYFLQDMRDGYATRKYETG